MSAQTVDSWSDEGCPLYAVRDIETSAEFESAPRTTERLPLHNVHVLPQIRQEYDAEEIESLAMSMIKIRPDGSRFIFVMNPPWVTWNNRASAQAYLDDATLYYADQLDGKRLSLDDYEPDETGHWQFCIAGHRRRLAIIRACERIGEDPNDYLLTAEALHNVSFDEANSDQGRENNHVRPPERDEAEDINRYVLYRKAKYGETVTIAEVAAVKGFGPNKVNDALKYAQLPQTIKDAEKVGEFSYSTAVVLGELQRLYARRAKKQGIHPGFNSAAEQAQYEIETYYFHIVHTQTERQNAGQRKLSNRGIIEKIEGQKGIVRNEILYESLFLDQADSGGEDPRTRRARLLEEFANTTLRAVGITVKNVPGMQERILDKLFEMMPGDTVAAETSALALIDKE